MAIVLLGKSKCVICNRVISSLADSQGFPAFLVNEADKFFHFNDAAVHVRCVDEFSDREELLRRVNEYLHAVAPSSRECLVCSRLIESEKSHVFIQDIGESYGLSSFRLKHLHKTCLPNWRERSICIEGVKKLESSRLWQGGYLKSLLEQIE